MSQTICNNIRPRILISINRKSTGSVDELRIILSGGRASALLQLGFLVMFVNDTDSTAEDQLTRFVTATLPSDPESTELSPDDRGQARDVTRISRQCEHTQKLCCCRYYCMLLACRLRRNTGPYMYL